MGMGGCSDCVLLAGKTPLLPGTWWDHMDFSQCQLRLADPSSLEESSAPAGTAALNRLPESGPKCFPSC